MTRLPEVKSEVRAGSAPASRLVSLDAFRGATVAAMLVVNNPGSWSSVYAPLDHAKWNGWTPTDMVFPFFLWIVGVALALSFDRRKQRGEDRLKLFQHVLVRSAVIFGLGLLLAAFPFGLWPGHSFSFSHLRIPGVLQRIAVCYAAASAICLSSNVRGQLVWAVGLLAVYAGLLRWFPVPGFGPGHLEPTGNVAWWIDSHVLAGHTWSGAPAPGFDPEGILSTLPAIATTLLGALTGAYLQRPRAASSTVGRLLVAGVVLLVIGQVLAVWLPINKNLWTSSYALFMAGAATVFFAGMHAIIEGAGVQRWATPFIILGKNAILVFVLSGLLARLLTLIAWTRADGARVTLKGLIYQGAFVPYAATPEMASLAFAVAFLLVLGAIAWAFWRRGWFLKV